MYRFSYAEAVDEQPGQERNRERRAIERSIELLQAAQAAGVKSREATEAHLFVTRLWGVLLEDLAKADNALAPELRADLISVGLWIVREVEDIRLGKSADYEGLIDVSQAIAGGLQ